MDHPLAIGLVRRLQQHNSDAPGPRPFSHLPRTLSDSGRGDRRHGGRRRSKCVDAAAKALGEFDPKYAESYQTNARAYSWQLAKLHEYGLKSIGSIPEGSRVLITSHDAFNYFGRAYGLEVQGVQGISTESEAGLQRINDLVDLLVKKNVKAVFVESSVPRKNIEALVDGAKSRGHEVSIGGELFSDAMGKAGTYEGTYVGMLDHNITLVTRALGGAAPEGGMQGKLSHAHSEAGR
ncbi:MAG: zinc ABC transporter substrate-binding protein [Planctomycetes bacterium]|nr:zinc ABC transporter substrate-binding protein [Planctomycetota bacterium]